MRATASVGLAAAFALVLPALPAQADETTGTVAHWDAASTTLTMADRTVWILGDAAPAALTPGQRVTILYQSAGEDGIAGIDAVRPLDAPTGSVPRS